MKNPLRIENKKGVWSFAISVTLLSIVASEFTIVMLYTFGGPEMFHVRSAATFAMIIPVLIAVPIGAAIGTMSLRLVTAQAELQRIAEEDDLTKLPNRRWFFASARLALDNANAAGRAMALLVIDADHFKQLNDSYGHAVGDKALVAIADVLRENFRDEDLVCRLGGEEFAVLVDGMPLTEAKHLATRVVEAVAANPLCEANAIIEYSVSCGIADTSSSYDLGVLFKAADDAMYLAKQRGRNRVALVSNAA